MTERPADPRAVAILGALAQQPGGPEAQLAALGYVAGLIATRAELDGMLCQDDAEMDLEAGFDRGRRELLAADRAERAPRLRVLRGGA